MRTLIVEDDFICRRLLQAILSPYGQCDTAVDGYEAIQAFQMAKKEGQPYHLICLDIMMPKLDGQATLEKIRKLEKDQDIVGLDGVKIIMTTVLNDCKHIKDAFREQCEAYLLKPIKKEHLLAKLQVFGLLANN